MIHIGAVQIYQNKIRFAKLIKQKYQNDDGTWKGSKKDSLDIDRIIHLVDRISKRASQHLEKEGYVVTTWQLCPAVYNGINGYEYNGRYEGVTLLDGPEVGAHKVVHI